MASKFVKNSILGTVAGLLTTLGSFACGLIVARMLGVHATGTVSYAVWLATTVATVAGLGFAPTVMRFLPEFIARDERQQAAGLASYMSKILAGLVVIVLLLGAAVALLVATSPLVRGWLPRTANDTPHFWLITALMFAGLTEGSFFIAYLKGMQQFDSLAKVTGIAMAAQVGAVLFGSSFFGVEGALTGYAIGALVPIVLYLRLPRGNGHLAAEKRSQVWRYTRNVWAASIVDAIVWARAEIFFLQYYWGNEQVGLFAVGLTITALAIQGPILATSSVLPHLAERFGRDDIKGMQDAYATGTRLLAFLLFPAGWGAAAIMPSLLPALFGPSFATAVPSAMVLVTIGCMGASVTIGSLLIYAMGRSEIIFRQGLLGAILTLTSGLIIVPHYGLLGAVWARAVIQLLMIGIGMYFIAVQLKCPVPFKSLTKILISAIISALAAHAIIRFIHGIPGICVAVPVGAIVYFAAVWISGGLTTSDNERLLALANDLGKSLIRFRPRLP